MDLWGIIKGLLVQEETDRTKQLSVEVDSAATTATRTTIKSAQTADRTLNLPDADDTLVGKATTDTLTNKTIDGDDNTIQDVSITSLKTEIADAGKFIERDGSGAVVSGKDVPGGDVVGNSDTQTLTNKTIDATSATGTNTLSADASDVVFDNSTSGLTATDSQSAIDEVEGRLDTAESGKLEGPGTHGDNLLIKTDGVDTNDSQVTGISIDDSNNVTGVNDLTVTGDLTVNGTTTTINTANLDVTDKNITVNDSGNDASSEGAGLTVERTGTDGSLVYQDALTSKFKIGALGAEVEIADVSSSQSITNKSMDSTNNITGASSDNLTRATGNQQVVSIPDTAGTDNIVLEAYAQVLTNKDIDGGTASNTNRMTIPKDTTTNLDALIDKEATIAYDLTLDSVVYNDGTQWIPLASNDPVIARYTAANVGAIPDTATVFDFPTSDIDTHSAVTTGASWVFTAPIAGVYEISACLHVNSSIVNGYQMTVRKNGTDYAVDSVAQEVAANFTANQDITCVVSLAASDTIDLRHHEFNNGGTYTQGTTGQYIEIKRIG